MLNGDNFMPQSTCGFRKKNFDFGLFSFKHNKRLGIIGKLYYLFIYLCWCGRMLFIKDKQFQIGADICERIQQFLIELFPFSLDSCLK